jgi:hypothetical protein
VFLLKMLTTESLGRLPNDERCGRRRRYGHSDINSLGRCGDGARLEPGASARTGKTGIIRAIASPLRNLGLSSLAIGCSDCGAGYRGR